MALVPYTGTYRITQRFGANPKSYERFGMKGHNGLDFALPSGTPLLSPVTGTVVEDTYDVGGYGYYVVVREDGTGNEWLLGHMKSDNVSLGQHVRAGAPLGLSDNTGNSTGPHLHLGYRPYGYDRTNGYYGYANPRPHLVGLPPYRVCVQAGHYPDGGGAPGEAKWTQRFATTLIPKLNALGVQTVLAGDYYNKPVPREVTEDYDLYYSIHYDASVYGATPNMNTGCFVDFGTPETEVWEAGRFNDLWESMYPRATAIPHRERANANTNFYYGFSPLSASTPGIVAEHGCGATDGVWQKDIYYPTGGDKDKLWGDTDAVADAVAAVFARYFNLSAGPVTPPVPTDEYRLERWGMFGMDQDNAIEFVLKPLYAMGGQTLIPNGGMTKAVADLYLGGLYFGRPLSGELPMPQRKDGVNGVQQLFEHGQVTYWLDGKAEWIGGMQVAKKATA